MSSERKRYQLELTPNDNAEDVHPAFWVFRGRWGVLLMVGMVGYVFIFQACSLSGLDIWTSIILAVIPVILSVLFVMVFVNGKPPGYAWDLVKQRAFDACGWLYARGLLDRPPQLWRVNKEPENPAH